jgi:hypothetical protein
VHSYFSAGKKEWGWIGKQQVGTGYMGRLFRIEEYTEAGAARLFVLHFFPRISKVHYQIYHFLGSCAEIIRSDIT